MHSEDASLLVKSARQQANALRHAGSIDPRYDVSLSTPVNRRINRALAREEAESNNADTDTEQSRTTKSAFLKIVGLLTSIVGITRRILSSVLTFATQASQDMITAHNLGMSYESVRNYRHVETVHNLKEGTITGAIADIQSKFGNITTLDEKALESLAVVMGGKIEEMATMGLGSSNPEKVLGAILDAFNEKANAGYNSVGQYVGEQQARRELYSYLLKVSPQIADIFATMQEEQHNINSLYRNQADTFENWKNAGVVPRNGNNIPAQDNVLVTTSQEWKLVKDSLLALKESVARDIAPVLLDIFRKINNMRFGMSESQNEALNQENKTANEQFILSAQKQLEFLKGSDLTEAERQRKLALQYYIKQAQEENESVGDIGNVVPTSDEIVVKGLSLAQAEVERNLINSDYEYSPELKHIVDFYVPEAKLKAFKNEYDTDLAKRSEAYVEEQVKNAKKRKKNERDEKVKKAQEKAVSMTKDKNSVYYLSWFDKQFKGINSIDTQQMAEIEALYFDTWSKENQDLWLATPVKERRSLAISWGLMNYNKFTGNWEGVKLPEVEELSFAEEMKIRERYKNIGDYKYAFVEEDFYVEAFKNWEDKLWKHLVGEYKERLAQQATEGTPLYDLDILQRDFGSDLAGLSALFEKGFSGNGAVISSATEENGIVTHRIVFDLNNNGKVDAKDIVLAEYVTNRISETGTVLKEVRIVDGQFAGIGTAGSEMK